MNWSPEQYLKFGEERTRAVRDLVGRLKAHLPDHQVRRVMDLGCGPANSTMVLRLAWPQAILRGLDASPTMLAAARLALRKVEFLPGDIAAWAASKPGPHGYDLVFSNSALQWVADHATLLPRLLARLAPGGALAFQVPADWEAAACQLPRDLAASAAWRTHFRQPVREWHSATLPEYYDMLAPHAVALELWETEYLQVMPNLEAILAWYQGSGLRPYLEALPDEAARERFCREYVAGLAQSYTPRADGRVLFPFRRRFVIARADPAPGLRRARR